MAGFIERMVRAARLDVHLYEEVEMEKPQWSRPWLSLSSPA